MSSQYYNQINKRDILQNIACIGDAVDKQLKRSDAIGSSYGEAYSKLARRENDLQRPQNSRAVSPNAPPPTVDCIEHMFSILNEATTDRYEYWDLEPECVDGEFFYACTRDDSLKKVVTKTKEDGTTQEVTVTYGFVIRQFWYTVEYSEEKGYNVPTYHESATRLIAPEDPNTIVEFRPRYEGRWHQLFAYTKGDNYCNVSSHITKQQLIEWRNKEEVVVEHRYRFTTADEPLIGIDNVKDALRNWFLEYNDTLFFLWTRGGEPEHCQTIFKHDGTACSLVYNLVDTSVGYTADMFKNQPETRLDRPGIKDFGWWGACTNSAGDIVLIVETYSRVFLNINATTGECVKEDLWLYDQFENGIITTTSEGFHTSTGKAKRAGGNMFGCLVDHANYFYLDARGITCYVYFSSSFSASCYNSGSDIKPAMWMLNEETKTINIATLGSTHPANTEYMNRPYAFRKIDDKGVYHYHIHAAAESDYEDKGYAYCVDLGEWRCIDLRNINTYESYYHCTPILIPINYRSTPLYPPVDYYLFRFDTNYGVIRKPYIVSLYNIVDYVSQINGGVEKLTNGTYRISDGDIVRNYDARYQHSRTIANFSHVYSANYNNHRAHNRVVPTHNYRNHVIEYKSDGSKNMVKMYLGATAAADDTSESTVYFTHLDCVFMFEFVKDGASKIVMKTLKFAGDSTKEDGKRFIVNNEFVRGNMIRGDDYNFIVDDKGVLWMYLYGRDNGGFKNINVVVNGTVFNPPRQYDYYGRGYGIVEEGVRFEDAE